MRLANDLLIMDDVPSGTSDFSEEPVVRREAVTTVVPPPPLMARFPAQIASAGLVKEFVSSVVVGVAFGVFLGYVLKKTKTVGV